MCRSNSPLTQARYGKISVVEPPPLAPSHEKVDRSQLRRLLITDLAGTSSFSNMSCKYWGSFRSVAGLPGPQRAC